MPIELFERDIHAIATKVAQIVLRRLKAGEEQLPEMVDTNEAARILKITPCRMRQIAHRFPHIKQGENKQGKLLFVRKALLQNY